MKLLTLLFFALLTSIPSFLVGQVVVNEYSVSNLSDFIDEYLKYEDWIELYNPSDAEVDLAGYFLSDNPEKPEKWEIPSGTTIPAKGFRVFWASGRDVVNGMYIHTNFKLSQTKTIGESIVFSNPAGNVINEIKLNITQNHHSRGRVVDGEADWGIFTNPTIGTSNGTATTYSKYALRPVLSKEAGFYSGSVQVSIADDASSIIRYTIDGSEPLVISPAYTEPITISKTTVLKAKAFSLNPAILPSLIDFGTFFIDEFHKLRVISVASEQLDLLLAGDKAYFPIGTFELFENNELMTAGVGDFNSHGQDSWVHDQRSIDYIARDEMGYDGKVRHKLYETSDREEFQRVVIRASGDDNYPGYDTSAHVRDVYVQTLADLGGLHLDVRKGARCVMYVNGKYWGVYSTREKVDDPDYTKYYHGQSKYDLDFLMTWGDTWIEYGNDQTQAEWNDLYHFITTKEMSNPAHYKYVTDRYNVKSLVDYILVNSFVVCTDWLNYNVGWWKGNNPKGDHKKWGYILWDEDATFNHYINYTGVPSTDPDTDPCYAESLNNQFSDPEGHITVLNNLRQNPEFDQYYISRYIDLANSTFSCENMLEVLDEMVADIAPEMPRHIQKFGGNMTQWEANTEKLRNFIIARCEAIPAGLNDCYALKGPYNTVLDVSPVGSGMISINSLEVKEFPWEGSYHGGVDVLLKAIPYNADMAFDHWELKNHTLLPGNMNQSAILQLLSTDTIVAVFSTPVVADSLVINEINYNSTSDFEAEDWVEFYNPHDYNLEVSGWIFKDDNDGHEFVFPQGTTVPSHQYVVICNDTTAFKSQYPLVNNYLGNFDFGLSKGGELLRLYNAQGALVDTVLYDDKEPWPMSPDGEGPTLELLNPIKDNALAESWKGWEGDHGTPGKINHGLVATEYLSEKEFSYLVQPNPFSDQATLSIQLKNERLSGQLQIIDVLGHIVQSYQVEDAKNIVIHRAELRSGVYFFQFIDNRNRLMTGRLVVE